MTINQTVSEAIGRILLVGPHQIRPSMRLVEDMNADSLDVVEIRVSIEDDLGVEFTDDEWDTVRTVGDAITLAVRKKELNLKETKNV